MWRFEKAGWRELVKLPLQLETRRAEFLAARTGRQLRQMMMMWQDRKPEEKLDRPKDEAFLRLWQETPPKYSIAQRVLGDAFRDVGSRPQTMLVVGHTEATIAAARDLWPPLKRVVAVERTQERRDQAQYVVDDPVRNYVYRNTLLEVARGVDPKEPQSGFDLVVASWHLSECASEKERDTVLAVLWGCVNQHGTLVIVEEKSEGAIVAMARARIVSPTSHSDQSEIGHVVAPCPHDGVCPLWNPKEQKLNCFFKQYHLRPNEGPPLRSNKRAAEGRAISTKHGSELFSYVAMKKARRLPMASKSREARVVDTPKKRGGHVHVDVCTSDALAETITLTKTRFVESGLDFKDARRLTWGSRLVYAHQLIFEKVQPRLMIVDGLPQRRTPTTVEEAVKVDEDAFLTETAGPLSRARRLERIQLRRESRRNLEKAKANLLKPTLVEALRVESELLKLANQQRLKPGAPRTPREKIAESLTRSRAARIVKYGAGGREVFKSTGRRHNKTRIDHDPNRVQKHLPRPKDTASSRSNGPGLSAGWGADDDDEKDSGRR